MLTDRDKHQVCIAHGKLVDRLTRAQEELQRLQRIEGRGLHSRLKRMNKLSDEIASLTKRINVAESMMEGGF